MIELKQSVSSKRHCILKSLLFAIIIFSLATAFLGFVYYRSSQEERVGYTEAGGLDYKVNLTEAGKSFYEDYGLSPNQDYLPADGQYIVKYIDDIVFDYSYTLNIDKKGLQYQYEYSVEKVFVIKKKGNDNIFVETREYQHPPIVRSAIGGKMCMINAQASINYAEYKAKVQNFAINAGIPDSDYTADLQVVLNVVIKGQGDKLVKDINESAVITANIPIEKQDVKIGVEKTLSNKTGVILCIPEADAGKLFGLFAVVGVLIVLVLIIIASIYYLISRTMFDVYHTKLAKITRNYGPYLTQIDGMVDLSDKKVFKVCKFTDLIEIRDTIQQPIIFTSDETSYISNFIIISQDMAFKYTLQLSDIKVSADSALQKATEKKVAKK